MALPAELVKDFKALTGLALPFPTTFTGGLFETGNKANLSLFELRLS